MPSMLPMALVWRALLRCGGCSTAVGSRDSILVMDAGTYRQPGQISSTALSHRSRMAGATLRSPSLHTSDVDSCAHLRTSVGLHDGIQKVRLCQGVALSTPPSRPHGALCPRPGLEPNKSTEERKPSIKLGRAGTPSGSSSFCYPKAHPDGSRLASHTQRSLLLACVGQTTSTALPFQGADERRRGQ